MATASNISEKTSTEFDPSQLPVWDESEDASSLAGFTADFNRALKRSKPRGRK